MFQLTIDRTNRFIMLIFQLAILFWGKAKGRDMKSNVLKLPLGKPSMSTLDAGILIMVQ